MDALIGASANANAMRMADGATPLFEASLHVNAVIVKRLVEAKANVNAGKYCNSVCVYACVLMRVWEGVSCGNYCAVGSSSIGVGLVLGC